MEQHARFKLTLLALAVSTALAACGGGGDDSTTTASTNSTSATGTNGSTLVASVGSSTGTASNTTGTSSPSLPPSPVVADKNVVFDPPVPPAVSYTGQAATLWAALQEWRDQVRYEETQAFGVGMLQQSAALDGFAAQAAAGTPPTVSGVAFPIVLTARTTNDLNIAPGAFCSKALLSSLPGVELVTSGVRLGGIAVNDATSTCAVVAGIDSQDSWQLPPTGSSSVYPFPGKQLTLTRYYGDFAGLNTTPAIASQPGHVVFASVASVDALPVDVANPDVSRTASQVAIPASLITLREFTLRVKTGGASVTGRVLVPTGMLLGAGVTAQASTSLRFPTSIAFIPDVRLPANTVFTASFKATVRGRAVERVWDFTTAD